MAHTDDAHPQLPPPTASGYADVCCCALAFLDASKAYDVAWRSAIISQLKSMGVCGKMLVLLTDMLSAGKVTRTVINGTARSERFVVDAGVPQGGVLSPVLYNIFIDSLVRELNREEHGFGITIAGVRVASLHFADDIVLCAKTPEELQRMLRVCSEHARTWHFSWNPTKSKIVVVGYADARKRFTQTITGTGAGACPATLLDAAGVEQALEVVNTYRYLGVEVDFNAQTGSEDRWETHCRPQRWAARNTASSLLTIAHRYSALPLRDSVTAYGTYARPRAEYAAQLWAPAITSTQRQHLDSVQHQFQSQVLNPNTYGGTRSGVSHAMATHELGVMPASHHADLLALRYWWHVHHAPVTSALYRIATARHRAAIDSLKKKSTKNCARGPTL